MDFWNVLAKVADILQVASFLYHRKPYLLRTIHNVPAFRLRRFAHQVHDLSFVILLVLLMTVMGVYGLSMPVGYAAGFPVVLILCPLALSLHYLRQPMNANRKLLSIAKVALFAVGFSVCALIAVCTLSILLNQSASNVFAYLTLPQQVIRLMPGMIWWSFSVSLAVPLIWVTLVPRIEAKSFDDMIRRLSR